MLIVLGLREIWAIWLSWGIRGCIIFSLLLQIFLFLFAPLRRKTASMVVNILLWSAYLLADWVPTFTAGLILKSLSINTSCSMDSSTGPPGVNDDLLALWAASLLWHLGGSFSVTAFALEDNELWFRHLTVMVVQFVTACYVFHRTLPDNKLIVPTIFALLGGFFSNVLRAHSMHLSSLDKCRKDIVMEHGSLDCPDAKAVECDLMLLQGIDPSRPVDHMLVLAAALQYFKFFKGLLVNIKCQSHEHQQITKSFCSTASPEVGYRLVSCELHFMYEMFYTNRIALPKGFGGCCWLISFVSCTLVLGLFFQADKQHFRHVDIRISNALVMVPLVLCLSAPYFFSYMQISLFIPKKENGGGGSDIFRTNPKLVPLFIIMHLRFWAQYFWGSITIRLRESQIKIKQDITHKIDSTPLIFREWSESICSHNLISYCLKERPRVISRPYRPWVAWICKIPLAPFQAIGRVLLFPGKLLIITFRTVLDKMGLKLDILDKAMYVSRDPFDKELWDFIFNNLRIEPLDTVARKLISEARGGWALQNSIHSTTLLHYIEDVEYDERLLLWHIATELCYNAKDDGGLSCSVNAEEIGKLSDRETGNNRVFSKMLSDYMLYLMVFQPGMMSTISGIFLKRYSVSCEQISRFHLKVGGEDGRLKEACRSILDQISRLPHEIHLGGEDGRLKEACRSILDRRAEFPKTDSEKDGAKTVVFRACALTEELKNLPKGERWRLLSRVWLEMLVYAARKCRGDIHAWSLCRGGELLTLVWLLMAHFGLIDAIVSRERKS